ncbi:MAG: hypothetical protein IJK38_13935 [Oscillospiraceae bacterium]|nr:hypothetical protein [Oscillospiraceae bacterium]
MKDKKLEERIQHSLNAELSGLRTTSYQRDQFFENATGGYNVKKKISMAAILVAALMLITVTALAVALLSGKQAVKEVLVPIATQSEEEVWTHDELDMISRQLADQGFTVTDDIRQKLSATDPLYKEQLLRLFMKMDYGEIPASWPLEEQAWYDELLVKYCLKEERTRFVPEEGEISEEQALSIARNYILETWQTDVSEDGRFELYIQYMLTEDPAGNRCKRWDITYDQADHSRYYAISITPTGEIAAAEVSSEQEEILDDQQQTDTGKEVLDLMIAMWQDDFYTVESLAAFSDRYGDLVRAIDNDWEQTTVLKAMLEIPYALPRAEDISPDAAMQKAKENAIANGWSEEQLALCRHSISYRVYPGEQPVYRVCFKLNDGAENRKLFYAGKMPFGIVIYLNPDNGEIKQINTLKQLDDFERFCEFPDVHDNIQNNGIG